MKKTLTLIFSLFVVYLVNAQQVSLETGKLISNYSYRYLNGEIFDNVTPKTNFFMNAGYKHYLKNTSIALEANLSYKSLGATASSHLYNNFYDWTFDYLGGNIGIDMEILKPDSIPYFFNGFTFGLRAAIGKDYVIKASLNENNLTFNLIDIEPYNQSLYYANLGGYINYYVTGRMGIYISYTYQKSIILKDLLFGTLVETTSMDFRNHCIGIGISFCLK